MHVSEAPECMRISRFMHSITNPDLIKKLNDNIPKSVDELMSVTTAFLREEVVVANQSKKKALPAWKHHETVHRPNFDKRLDFKCQHKSSRRQDRFTPLTKTPKEILATDTVKDKGHNTNAFIHLRRKIAEAVKSGHMSHLVKEVNQAENDKELLLNLDIPEERREKAAVREAKMEKYYNAKASSTSFRPK
nr:hypothetical protein [Tanacetum cinerariifolium]